MRRPSPPSKRSWPTRQRHPDESPGTTQGRSYEKYSLKHLVPHLQQLLNADGKRHARAFRNDCIGEQAFTTAGMLEAGEVLLLENLRFYKEEEKGDRAFAENWLNWVNLCQRRFWDRSRPTLLRPSSQIFSRKRKRCSVS